MLFQNYGDTETYISNLIKSGLENISDSEIQSIKKRIDFFVNHFKISTNKKYSLAKEHQLEFLMNINSAIESEISDRSGVLVYN